MVSKTSVLELELHTESKRRRELEDRSSAVERIRNRRDTRGTAVDQERLILFDSALVIENVEPIELQAELLILTQRNRVVSTQVQVVGRRRAVAAGERVDCRAARYATEAWNTEAFVVTIDRVRNQSVERNTRLRTERTARSSV